MKALPGGRLLAVAAVVLTVALAYAPTGFGFSGGITEDNAGIPDFNEVGCVGCHGPGPAPHEFAAGGADIVNWTLVDEAGDPVAGNLYHHGATYTLTITLDEQNAPDADNHAGFNLRVSEGTLEGVDGSSQVSDSGHQATHLNAGSASWQVTWTAPDAGVVVFDLFVNDVDGSAAPDEGDMVYRVGWWVSDKPDALPGSQAEEEHVEFGVSLQQYWIGLIGIAAMVVVMIFGYVYLKYANPHNADQKDR